MRRFYHEAFRGLVFQRADAQSKDETGIYCSAAESPTRRNRRDDSWSYVKKKYKLNMPF